MVRPENGLFFANATGIREAIVHEVNSSTTPVETVIVDMGAPSDLDAPSADMLIALHKELRERGVRLVLTRMIAPVSRVLGRADATGEIVAEDTCHSPVEAMLDFFASHVGAAGDRERVRAGLLEAHDLVQARMSAVSAEHRTSLAAILDIIDQEIEGIDAGPAAKGPVRDDPEGRA
jgi:SulP family sulfate permease